MGFGVINVSSENVTLVIMDILRLHSKLDAYTKLQIIHDKVQELLRVYCATEFAIEAPFFGKNVQSMLKLGYRCVGCSSMSSFSGQLFNGYFRKKTIRLERFP